ncbi:MAG: ParB N-terminal domain-containing protein [Calothrix sp. MO_167.B42]|nr:ParB N-terminal domain-containing protein [Calothrix sp. MO_167.B42]
MPKINIDKIYIGTNRRPIKEEKVKQLKESIKTNGLLNPIVIDSQLNLIAGLHRLTACKQLGLEEVECNIFDYQNDEQARLAEIDENLIRNELEALERAELWLERDRLLASMGLKAQPGDNQYTQAGGETVSLPGKTNLDFAQEIGYSKRTLQHGKQIAKDILPEVKDIIKGTAIANSPTKLLKVARAGNQERAVIEQAQKALEQAKQGGEQAEIDRQMQILAKARAKQKELQLIALKNVMAPREVKLTIAPEIPAVSIPVQIGTPEIGTQTQSSQEWILGRHRVYGGDTGGAEFINLLPGDAALAIATLSSTWNHDYAMEKARIVAVLRSQGHIYQFCRQHRMNFQYEFLVGNIYVGIFSHESISQPPTPIKVEGVEGVVNYLLHLYTSPNDVVIAPFMGQGEVLTTCERMGRICIVGDDNRELLNRGMMRWQNLTGKQVQNTSSMALRVSNK